MEAPEPSRPDEAQPRGKTRLRGLVALGVAVVTVKALYLFEYVVTLPFIWGPMVSSVVHLHQARAIRRGDFSDPSLVAFSPLYGWFLAIFDGGRSPVWAAIVQLGFGCASLFIVRRISERIFGAVAATATALLFLGYGTLLFYESKILPETLGFTLAAAAMLLFLSPAFAAGRLRTAFVCGVTVGVSILVRASLLFSAPVFIAVALLRWEPASDAGPAAPLSRVRRAAVIAVGVVLVLGANGLWNLRNTGQFVPVIFVTSSLDRACSPDGVTRLSSLSQEGSGTVAAGDVLRVVGSEIGEGGERRGRDVSPVAGVAAGFESWARGAPSKLQRTFGDLEMTAFEYLYYGERSEVRMLNLLRVTFGALLLLGALGGWLQLRRLGARSLLPFLPHVVGALAVCTLYNPSSRYRMPIVLPLLVLGGGAVSELLRIPDRRRRVAILSALSLVCAALAVRTVLYKRSQLVVWEVRCAQAAILAGQVDEIQRRNRRMCAIDPLDEAVLFHLRSTMRLPQGCAGVPAGEL